MNKLYKLFETFRKMEILEVTRPIGTPRMSQARAQQARATNYEDVFRMTIEDILRDEGRILTLYKHFNDFGDLETFFKKWKVLDGKTAKEYISETMNELLQNNNLTQSRFIQKVKQELEQKILEKVNENKHVASTPLPAPSPVPSFEEEKKNFERFKDADPAEFRKLGWSIAEVLGEKGGKLNFKQQKEVIARARQYFAWSLSRGTSSNMTSLFEHSFQNALDDMSSGNTLFDRQAGIRDYKTDYTPPQPRATASPISATSTTAVGQRRITKKITP